MDSSDRPGGNDYQMTYRFTDIYGNQFWTPSISD